MLLVDYCPQCTSDDGSLVIFLPDSKVKQYVDETIESYLKDREQPDSNGLNTDYHVRIGQELIILQFRVSIRQAIRDKKLTSNDVRILFNGQVLTLDDDGRLDPWPDGFCDYSDKLFSALLGWD